MQQLEEFFETILDTYLTDDQKARLAEIRARKLCEHIKTDLVTED